VAAAFVRAPARPARVVSARLAQDDRPSPGAQTHHQLYVKAPRRESPQIDHRSQPATHVHGNAPPVDVRGSAEETLVTSARDVDGKVAAAEAAVRGADTRLAPGGLRAPGALRG